MDIHDLILNQLTTGRAAGEQTHVLNLLLSSNHMISGEPPSVFVLQNAVNVEIRLRGQVCAISGSLSDAYMLDLH